MLDVKSMDSWGKTCPVPFEMVEFHRQNFVLVIFTKPSMKRELFFMMKDAIELFEPPQLRRRENPCVCMDRVELQTMTLPWLTRAGSGFWKVTTEFLMLRVEPSETVRLWKRKQRDSVWLSPIVASRVTGADIPLLWTFADSGTAPSAVW